MNQGKACSSLSLEHAPSHTQSLGISTDVAPAISWRLTLASTAQWTSANEWIPRAKASKSTILACDTGMTTEHPMAPLPFPSHPSQVAASSTLGTTFKCIDLLLPLLAAPINDSGTFAETELQFISARPPCCQFAVVAAHLPYLCLHCATGSPTYTHTLMHGRCSHNGAVCESKLWYTIIAGTC